MLRMIPVDGERVGLVATGQVEPCRVWAERDGRRVLTDDVERDEVTGHQLWTVHAMALSGDRPEVVSVRVPAPTIPTPDPLSPVYFDRLTVNVRVDRAGKVAGYWSAAGMADTPTNRAPARAGAGAEGSS